ncbi:MAG: hypothetical protein M3217_07465 [Actinomycetota bacterium]|nr:hypothetical protein [Actinomycetota bacterium]
MDGGNHKRLVLSRETLRKLGARTLADEELREVQGGGTTDFCNLTLTCRALCISDPCLP